MGDTPDPSGEAGSIADRLDSWKEIAAHLRRSLATVQRWEKREGLPVHRHLHGKLGSVWARKSEIDAWWVERRLQLEAPPPSGVAEEGRAMPRRPRGLWLKLAGVTLALGAALLLVLRGEGRGRWPSAAGRTMIAVLPFENLTGDPQQEFFCDGITEEMITLLGGLGPERLGVIARTSSMKLKGARKDVREIGRELGVGYVLEGSVRRDGDRVRIAAQLILASDQTHLWAQSYDRDVADILAVQTGVARAVANQIRLELTPRQQARLTSGRTVNHQAFDAYLRGRHELNRRSADSVEHAIRYFRAAIEADPAYVAPHAGLADSYNQLGTFAIGAQSPRETRRLARSAAQAALAIDDQLAEAHAALGYADLYDWSWKPAESSLRRALELNPSYPWAHL
jgi:TolB-like protein